MSRVSNSARTSVQQFLEYVNTTGSPYHSVLAAREILENAGFERIVEKQGWPGLEAGKKYYVTRNHSTIMAFVVGGRFDLKKGGFAITGAHTDSPCLRVRPNSDMASEGYNLLGVETYGGGLWHTWMDRGLGIAGKVVVRQSDGSLEEKLVRVAKPLMIIPNLAIHLQSAEERSALKLNTENHIRPILCAELSKVLLTPAPTPAPTGAETVSHEPIKTVLAEAAGCKEEDIMDLDVCVMDATDARTVGIYEEFVESARIDNLASTWASVAAISELEEEKIQQSCDIMAAISWDHEEIGSLSYTGANSATLETWMREILEGVKACEMSAPDASAADSSVHSSAMFANVVSRSFLLSVDGAHGAHPNYAERHQAQHKPMLNKGVVIKENCNQRYSSTAGTMAVVRAVAEKVDPKCPLQNFVVKNDSPCGSTIGPMTTARIGIRGVDIGIPQWAMHSIRETCGASDLHYLKALLSAFYTEFRSIDEKMICL